MGRSSTVATDQLRTAVRFPMRARATGKDSDRSMDAVTENISANGILFHCEERSPGAQPD